MAGIPLSPEAKITVGRRGEIVLIGINRPQIHNRFDPDALFGLAAAYYDVDNDPSPRAAVFFGHGENFSRGIDVDAFAPLPESASRSRSRTACSIPSPEPRSSEAPDRGGPWRYLEHGPRTASGGRHLGGQRRRTVRPGREDARTVPRRRLDHPPCLPLSPAVPSATGRYRHERSSMHPLARHRVSPLQRRGRIAWVRLTGHGCVCSLH
jgi:hypothetical protein